MELFKLIIFTLSQFSKQVNNFCHESGGSFLFVLYELARSQFSLLRRLNDSLKKGKASSPDRKILPPPPQISSICKIWKQERHSEKAFRNDPIYYRRSNKRPLFNERLPRS